MNKWMQNVSEMNTLNDHFFLFKKKKITTENF